MEFVPLKQFYIPEKVESSSPGNVGTANVLMDKEPGSEDFLRVKVFGCSADYHSVTDCYTF